VTLGMRDDIGCTYTARISKLVGLEAVNYLLGGKRLDSLPLDVMCRDMIHIWTEQWKTAGFLSKT
jgi:hypothetical protein